MLFLLACTSVELSFSPSSLDFGDVDFSGEMPEGGYASETVTVTNVNGPTVALTLPEYDTDRLCLAGFDDREYPVELGDLDEAGTYLFEVGVCAYLPGEETTTVATDLVVKADGTAFTLPITFTAIRTE